MIKKGQIMILALISLCLPSIVRAQSACQPNITNPEYYQTCSERLTTNSYSSGGTSYFEVIDNAGSGGIDFTWYNTTQNCVYVANGSSIGVPSNGEAYVCIASISGTACRYLYFTATAPTPPPAPVPVTPTVYACGAGQSILEVTANSSMSFQWYESSTNGLLQSDATGYLSTGESYYLNSAGTQLTIYHSNGPLQFDFYVKNGTSSPANISLIVLPPLPPLSPSGTVKICSNCSQEITAQYSSDQTYQWMRNGAALPNATSHILNTSEAGLYRVDVQAYGCTRSSSTLQINKNIPPTAHAGEDIYNYYPNMSSTGFGIDTDGNITALHWTQISGPSVTINDPSSSTMVVSAPPVGTYVFRLTVTDDNGDTGYDDVTIYKRPESEICQAPLASCPPRTFNTSTSPYCSSSPTQFTFNIQEVDGYGGLIYTWYKITDSGCELVQGQNGSSFTTSVVQTGVSEQYQCRISSGGSDCYSFSFSASLTPPPPPISVVNSAVIACGAGQSYLEIVPEAGYVYTWNEAALGVIPADEMVSLPEGQGYLQLIGSKLTIQHSEQQQSLSFTVNGIVSGAQCNIPATASLSFTVVENQIVISAPDAAVCGEGIVMLSASSTGISDYKWYNSTNIHGDPWKTGSQVESEFLTSPKSYFVKATDQYGCVKTEEVLADVLQLPPDPVVHNVDVCAWDPVDITPENGGYTLWYNNGSNDVIQRGGVFRVDPIGATGQFLYNAQTVGVNGCPSDKTSFTISVLDNCDENLNWIHSTSYDANGSVSESRSYFDEMGRPMQGQVKSFSSVTRFGSAKVFASQELRDQYDLVVGRTLSAPISDPDFKYIFEFALNSSGQAYNYLNFDNPYDENKKLNPDPFGSIKPGTVGWYYSVNNDLEDHVPATGYPYSRSDFYDDGTGEVRRTASPGDVHRFGGGHEVLQGTFPVFSELNDYLIKRTTVLPNSYQDGNLTNEGVQFVSRDANGRYTITISDKSGRTVISARDGEDGESTSAALHVPNNVVVSVTAENPTPMVYFYILQAQDVQISGPGTYAVEDLISGKSFTPSGNWPGGFYRVMVKSGSINVQYENHYFDVSYLFYDDANRLRASITPNGYSAWKTGTDYQLIDKTTYVYNHRGWLLSQSEPDAGATSYLYRRDGKIRFSQNALQFQNESSSVSGEGKFSYTNYDDLGRPIESGEYKGNMLVFSSLNSEVEYDQQVPVAPADAKDWMKTHYDDPAVSIPNLPSSFSQKFVRGAVSWTENINIKTWYSYDELGRVTWMAQKPAALNRTFLTEYEYDFLGNVLKVVNSSYFNEAPGSEFYHHYEYDDDKRLSKVYTSTDGASRRLRASYEYYLHGPLKRIELGNEIQGIDFVYNINGWLTHINHPDKSQDPGGDGNDVFGMILDYYQNSLEGTFDISDIMDSNRPEIFHRIPQADDVSSSLALNQPHLFFKNELLRNLQELRGSRDNSR